MPGPKRRGVSGCSGEVVVRRAWPEHQEHAGHDTADARATIPADEDLGLVLIVILVLVVLWRGPETLPKLGSALGRGVREARHEAAKAQEEIQSRASGEPTATPASDPTDLRG